MEEMDAQNFISTPKDMVIHFRRESAAITLHKVYQHTHTYSMCTCREIEGNIRWQSKMCIDQRISVHPFKQICTLTHMYRHTH